MRTRPGMITLAVIALVASSCAWAARAQQSAAEKTEGAAPEMVGEPTEEVIRVAYTSALERVNEGTLARLGAEDGALLLLTLEDLTKLVCRSMNRAGVHYDCRVERRMRRADEAPVTDVVQLWLSYEEGRWAVR